MRNKIYFLRTNKGTRSKLRNKDLLQIPTLQNKWGIEQLFFFKNLPNTERNTE